ncbi:unnamed protein product [Notodromas monacha]|uniref:Uncharacterized protein n=1 Tax=Notodromas monacha TaxID=399045 RepID=A0A7R9BW52_9CRUS|nr:unnamed protein product [Notodromas monacha]CAG0922904.1 unnamed protein product [Notodromas monacha]
MPSKLQALLHACARVIELAVKLKIPKELRKEIETLQEASNEVQQEVNFTHPNSPQVQLITNEGKSLQNPAAAVSSSVVIHQEGSVTVSRKTPGLFGRRNKLFSSVSYARVTQTQLDLYQDEVAETPSVSLALNGSQVAVTSGPKQPVRTEEFSVLLPNGDIYLASRVTCIAQQLYSWISSITQAGGKEVQPEELSDNNRKQDSPKSSASSSSSSLFGPPAAASKAQLEQRERNVPQIDNVPKPKMFKGFQGASHHQEPIKVEPFQPASIKQQSKGSQQQKQQQDDYYDNFNNDTMEDTWKLKSEATPIMANTTGSQQQKQQQDDYYDNFNNDTMEDTWKLKSEATPIMANTTEDPIDEAYYANSNDLRPDDSNSEAKLTMMNKGNLPPLPSEEISDDEDYAYIPDFLQQQPKTEAVVHVKLTLHMGGLTDWIRSRGLPEIPKDDKSSSTAHADEDESQDDNKNITPISSESSLIDEEDEETYADCDSFPHPASRAADDTVPLPQSNAPNHWPLPPIPGKYEHLEASDNNLGHEMKLPEPTSAPTLKPWMNLEVASSSGMEPAGKQQKSGSLASNQKAPPTLPARKSSLHHQQTTIPAALPQQEQYQKNPTANKVSSKILALQAQVGKDREASSNPAPPPIGFPRSPKDNKLSPNMLALQAKVGRVLLEPAPADGPPSGSRGTVRSEEPAPIPPPVPTKVSSRDNPGFGGMSESPIRPTSFLHSTKKRIDYTARPLPPPPPN